MTAHQSGPGHFRTDGFRAASQDETGGIVSEYVHNEARRKRRGKIILTAVVGSALAGGAVAAMMAPRSCTPQQVQAGQCRAGGGGGFFYFGSSGRSTTATGAGLTQPGAVQRGGFGFSGLFHGIGA